MPKVYQNNAENSLKFKICTFLGTRPEIVKLSPLLSLLDSDTEINHVLIHTGQHYDPEMDMVFFQELHLNKPNYNFNIGSESPGKQTALLIEKAEQVLLAEKPHLVIILGDTNTVPGTAITASKLHIPIMHIEAGCRSFNKEMPEEINRIIADHLSTYFIAPDEQSVQNLHNENITQHIFMLGSTAFDAVERNRQFIDTNTLKNINIVPEQYLIVTIHRAENTKNKQSLENLIAALNILAERTTLVFPLHPRTKKSLEQYNIILNPKICIIPPQPYISFLALLSQCTFCLTDSGSIQEETLVFNKPCFILRNETEWMRLVNAGKNFLTGTTPQTIVPKVQSLLNSPETFQNIKNIKYDYPKNVSQKIMEVIKEKIRTLRNKEK